MELLLVPIILTIGVWWLDRSEKNTEREISQTKARQETLELYIQQMTDLLLNHNLASSNKDEVKVLARAWTISALRNLDGMRKGQALSFLSEARLIHKDNPIIDLTGADLTEAHLRYANLQGAKLSKVILIDAYLGFANLRDVDLTESRLDNAELFGIHLQGADLSFAIFDSEFVQYVRGQFKKGDFESLEFLKDATLMNGENFDSWKKKFESKIK